MNIYDNNDDAYLGTLAAVFDTPDSRSSPRGQGVREKFNYQFTIVKPTVEYIKTHDLERNKVIAAYSLKEFDLYQSCSNRVEDFEKASKFWSKLANPDGTINSAYGYLIWKKISMGLSYETMNTLVEVGKDGEGDLYETKKVGRTPWQWSLLCLKNDKDTRQAVMKFSLPEHFYQGNKDFTCTLHGFWQIRNDKLDLTINMRSNDLTLGLVYDLPWFISLMYKMKDELKQTYPNLEIGNYTHYVHNLHIYDRDETKILKMLGRAQ